IRRIQVRDGAAVAFIGVSHDPWSDGEKRFGVVRPLIHQDEWSDAGFEWLVGIGHDWLRDEAAEVAVARIREEGTNELEALARLGSRETRRSGPSERDLVGSRDQLLESARAPSARALEQGVVMNPLSEDPDPDKRHKLYELMVESVHDIPRSVPDHEMTFE